VKRFLSFLPFVGRRVFYLGFAVLVGAAFWVTRSPRSPVPIAWVAHVPWMSTAPVAVDRNGNVYVGAIMDLFVFDRNGKLRWKPPRDMTVDSAPVIGLDGTVYLRESEKLRFLDSPPDAPTSTNRGLVALRPDGTVKWRFPAADITEHSGVAFALDRDGHIYFASGANFSSSKTLYAVGPDGRELWHFDSPGSGTAPVGIRADGSVVFESDGRTNFEVYQFDGKGQSLAPPAHLRTGAPRFSMDWDGTTYLPGDPTNTITALNADGSRRWVFAGPYRAMDAPTIGPDGSLYFAAQLRGQGLGPYLVALSKDGQMKWSLYLANGFCFAPPAVASDGTLYITSGAKLTAVRPDGTVKWVFEPPRTVYRRMPQNLGDLKRMWTDLRGKGNVAVGPAILTTAGRLYVNFGGPYETLYAFDVGVGLATNSPWPLPEADPQLTWRVADRPPGVNPPAKKQP
jgi:outer membrane protein assembly factor BamB